MKRLLILTAILAFAFSVLSSGVAASTISYVDPAPPSGWYQCAGFVNTAGDDIDSSFMDDCLYSEGLRVKVWDSSGTLEEDVYATWAGRLGAWPSGGYFGTGSMVKAKSTYWTGSPFFFTTTNGQGPCDPGLPASASGLTVGSSAAVSASVAAGNLGDDEYMASCGYYGWEVNSDGDWVYVFHPSTPLPGRKIAIYINIPPDPCNKFLDDLSKDKTCCVSKGFEWLESGETRVAASAPVAESSDAIPSLAVAYATSEYYTAPYSYMKSGYISRAYLARSPDGGATWPSNSQIRATEPQDMYGYSVSVSGSGANDVGLAFAPPPKVSGSLLYGSNMEFYGVDSAISGAIELAPTSTTAYLNRPSLKALDKYNMVASYVHTHPSSSACSTTANWLKFASSADGGKSWSLPAVVETSHTLYGSVDADAVDQAIFIGYDAYSGPYATCGQGGQMVFAKSTDGGTSWTRSAIEPYSAGSPSLSAADAKNVFVAYSSSGMVKVASTADGGLTWKKVSVDYGSSPSIKAFSISSLVVAYIGVDGKLKFAKSANGGATWAASTVEPSAIVFNAAMGVAGSSQVYIAYTTIASNNIVVARSSDLGATWSKSAIVSALLPRSLSLYVEAKASKAYADPEFKDSRGERTAPEGVRLVSGGETCSSKFTWAAARSMECAAGVCTSNPSDAALCDKASDCVYNGKCYSDIKSVAATFFSSDMSAVWNSAAWKPEVAADVNGDTRLEVCDPGMWINPKGTVVGTVTDFTTGAPLGAATINMVGTPPNAATTFTATTAADGTYSIADVDAINYDITASATGYDIYVKANKPIQPFQTNTVNFQLIPAGAGGMWGGGTATISGTVTNITSQPVPGAVVKVLGTSLTATTDATGAYSIPNVPSGTYDITASKPSDGYADATALGIEVLSGTTTVDFTLLLSLGSCTNDCTKVGSSACDAGCDGKGACKFYSEETKRACDGTFGSVSLPGGRQVSCCKGQPYSPQKADVTIPAKQVIKNVKPVLYQGRLVNLVTLLFIPDRQG